MSMFSIFLVLIIVVAFLLILVIMVQNPKGGGLSSSFGGGSVQVAGGVKKTGDFLDKSTWVLASILAILILLSNIALTNRSSSEPEAPAQATEKRATPPNNTGQNKQPVTPKPSNNN